MLRITTENPSVEGQVEEILLDYLRAIDEGRNPDPREIIAQHPDLEGPLKQFFADANYLHPVLAPMRELRPGRTIGDFADLEVLSVGGMGVVYKARHLRLGHTVALKMIRDPDLSDGDAIERFKREARNVAILDHPNIIPIYHIDEFQGMPYFTMKYIEGGSLTRALDQFRLNPRATAILLAQVARAVHHAHQRGIIHRDLKPGNILLCRKGEQSSSRTAPSSATSVSGETPTPVEGIRAVEHPAQSSGTTPILQPSLNDIEPILTDFGLARAVLTDGTEGMGGAIAGTPPYMAPEQARGVKDLTIAVDVYGLGALLYEMLTGQPPFQGPTQLDTLLLVIEAQPTKPCKLNKRVDPDLQLICLKCLEKDPAKRYATPLVVAEELENWLAGNPLERTRPVGPLERLTKWAKRRPGVAGLLFLITLTATVGMISCAWAWKTTVDNLQLQAYQLYVNHIQLAQEAFRAEEYDKAEHELNECALPLRGWEWHYLRGQLRRDQIYLEGQAGLVKDIAFTPAGQTLLSACGDGSVLHWSLRPPRSIKFGEHRGGANSVRVLDHGRYAVSAGEDEIVNIWDLGEGASEDCLQSLKGGGILAAGSVEKPLVAAVTRAGKITAWTVTRQNAIPIFQEHVLGSVNALALSADGQYLAICGYNGLQRLWKLPEGKAIPLPAMPPRTNLERSDAFSLAFTPESKHLAIGTAPLTVVDVATGELLQHFYGASELRPSCITFSLDAKLMATTYRDGLVRVWDRARGRILLTREDPRYTLALRFSPEGRSLALGRGADILVQTLQPTPPRLPQPLFKADKPCWALTFHPDGTLLATRTGDRQIQVWDVQTGACLHTLHAQDPIPDWCPVVFDRAGRLLCGGQGAFLQVWDVQTGASLPGFVPAQQTRSLALSVEGAHLATTTGDNRIRVWDWPSGGGGKVLTTAGEVQALAWRPGKAEVACSLRDGQVEIWAVAGAPRRLSRCKAPPLSTTCLTYSPDGKRLAAAGTGRILTIWNANTGTIEQTLSVGHSVLFGLTFSADSQRLATCGGNGRVTLWDLRSGRELLTLTEGSRSALTSVAFGPRGWLGACGLDGTVLLWTGGELP